ncbi:MAG: hypothetical protein JWN30_1400 [Bacilli bacterium]|nr:hypothetical protein [Bacilli bacterium]
MGNLRPRIAVFAGKCVLLLLRLTGRKGTTLPGAVALKAAPDLLSWMGKQLSGRVILITGTNGKTTTANFLTNLLKLDGIDVIHNTLGANLLTGIATCLLNGLRPGTEQVAVLEVDEATMRHVVPKILPASIVVTNFFRDQMDRYGEVDHVMELVGQAISLGDPAMKLILNADDPLVAALGAIHESVIWYGIESTGLDTGDDGDVRDGRHCLVCGSQLKYQRVFYGGLGHYGCSFCEFARPVPTVPIMDVEAGLDKLQFTIWGMTGTLTSKALYNVYNAAAALIGASMMGVSTATLSLGMQNMETGLGRMERFDAAGRAVVLTLVKNPTGFNQALRVLETETAVEVQFILNDLYADGTDVSWIWDTNLERVLQQAQITRITASGTRAFDMAVRLKYAGWSGQIDVQPGDVQAVKTLLELPHGGSGPLYILSTYTSLYKVRDFLLNYKGGGAVAEV